MKHAWCAGPCRINVLATSDEQILFAFVTQPASNDVTYEPNVANTMNGPQFYIVAHTSNSAARVSDATVNYIDGNGRVVKKVVRKFSRRTDTCVYQWISEVVNVDVNPLTLAAADVDSVVTLDIIVR